MFGENKKINISEHYLTTTTHNIKKVSNLDDQTNEKNDDETQILHHLASNDQKMI